MAAILDPSQSHAFWRSIHEGREAIEQARAAKADADVDLLSTMIQEAIKKLKQHALVKPTPKDKAS